MSKMEKVILGAQARQSGDEDVDQFAEGIIKAVKPEGATFTIPDWDNGKHVFGPAPWPRSLAKPIVGGDGHTHETSEPPVGSRCLVLFVGAGVDRPWILGWWS